MADKSAFTYAIYISASPEMVWKALLDGEFTRQYWGRDNVSDWKPGSRWEHRRLDATVAILGEVLEADPPRHLVLSWGEPKDKDNKNRHSRVKFEIEPMADMVRLIVTHDRLEPEIAGKISQGWPRILSSLKSLLETGRPLDTWAVPVTTAR
jgi:uncharacterized protein YndB with AHSA1/START domain